VSVNIKVYLRYESKSYRLLLNVIRLSICEAIYIRECKSSRGHLTRGGPPALVFGRGLTTPHHVKACYEKY